MRAMCAREVDNLSKVPCRYRQHELKTADADRAAERLGAFSIGWLTVYVIVTGLSSLYQAYLAGSQQFRLSAKLMSASAVLQQWI